jgi:antitoxin component YwqK of YwqJK toxin-antitoxin module
MKKRILIVFLFSIIVAQFTCRNNENNFSKPEYFSEEDFNLVKTKLDDFGKRSAEYYTSKKNNTRQMMKLFWSNQKIQVIVYLKDKKKEGPYEFYDTSGRLQYEGFFFEDKESGVFTYYERNGEIKNIEFFNKGDKIGEVSIDSFIIK